MPGNHTAIGSAKSSRQGRQGKTLLPATKALSTAISKKEQVESLYCLGITAIEELASLTRSRPSYIANVLRERHLLAGYFDLYTSTERPMNVYSKFFAKKLGFKNTAVARRSVHCLETLYRQFERTGDRAGQHHTLLMGLTMRNRAVWGQKDHEADIFTTWLIKKLTATTPRVSPATHLMQRHLAHREARRAR